MSVSSGITSLASKFRGCLIGGLLGDCIGAPFEGDFPVSKTVLKNYLSNFLSDSPRTGSVQLLSYTDDTAMTLSVAKSLVEKRTFDPKDMAKKFVDEFFHQPKRGYGMNVVDVFSALKTIDFQDVFEPAKRQFEGTGSYGNGAAMRVAPVALYGYEDEELVKQIAKDSALLTHFHQHGYNGAILQSLAVHQALTADTSNDIDPIVFVDTLLEKMEKIEKEVTDVGLLQDKKPFCAGLKKVKNIFEKHHLDMSAEEIAGFLGNHISAHKSVPTAIFSFLRGFHPLENFESNNPFARTLYFAISVGGDTDTIACMAGSIAGAYHGESVIPENLKIRCEAVEELKNLGDQLFQLHQKE